MHDLPQIPEHCLPTKYARESSRSQQEVVMLFCPSFTQSERFLHSHVEEKRDRERVQVRCSDLVCPGSIAQACTK